MKTKSILFAFLYLSSLCLWAQQGFLDTTFNTAGPVKGRADIYFSKYEKPGAMIEDSIGRTLVASYDTVAASITVCRLKFNGIIDSSFGVNGFYVSTWSQGQKMQSLATQPDGKILIGGSKTIIGFTGPAMPYAMVMRLNVNGTIDNSFSNSGEALNSISGFSNYRVTDLKVQSNGQIVVIGQCNAATGAPASFMYRLNADGTIDNSFALGKGIVIYGSEYWKSLQIYNGKYFISGDFNNNITKSQNLNVLRFFSDGTVDSTFGTNGRANLSLQTTDYTNNLVIQPDGKILVSATNNSQFKVARFLNSGKVDSSFGNSYPGVFQQQIGTGSYASLKGMATDKTGRLILIGHAYYVGIYSYAATRTTPNGKLDSSFAQSGTLVFNNGNNVTVYGAAMSHDQKLLVYAQDVPGKLSVAKIQLMPVMHIIGKDYVQQGTGNVYSIKVPSSWNYNYAWTYSGKNTYFFPDSLGQKVFLFFTDSATSGTLTCYAKQASAIISYDQRQIIINSSATAADQLAKLSCEPGVSDCSSDYIDNFKLHNIVNDSSDCNSSGYSDFTQAGFTDTLYVGGVYTVDMTVQSSEGVSYYGLWIDYNNDGTFDSTSEFISQGYSASQNIEIRDIVFQNQSGYTGPKRLRVRCSSVAPISGSVSCQTDGESGETEDYLIILKQQDNLQAPQIITPNDDGKNDFFVIRGVDPTSESKLMIFDRWGDLKFNSSNYQNNWDGKSDGGDKLLPGTYYYLYSNKGESIKGYLEIRY